MGNSEDSSASLVSSRFITESIYSFVSTVAVNATQFINVLIFASILSPTDFGTLSVITPWIAMFAFPAMLGIPYAITKFIAEYQLKDPQKGFRIQLIGLWIILLSTTSISLIVFFISGFAASGIYNDPSLTFLFGLTAFVIFFQAIGQYGLSVIRGYRLIKRYAIINGTIAVVGVGITYLMVLNLGLLGGVLSIIFTNIILFFCVSLQVWRVWKKHGNGIHLELDKSI